MKVTINKATDAQLISLVRQYIALKNKGVRVPKEVEAELFRSTLAHVKLLNNVFGGEYVERSLIGYGVYKDRYIVGEFLNAA